MPTVNSRNLTITSAWLEGALLAYSLVEQAYISVAVSFADTEYGRTSAQAFRSVYRDYYGYSITAFYTYQINKSDYSAEAAMLALKGGQALVLFGEFNAGGREMIIAEKDSGGFEFIALGARAFSKTIGSLVDPGEHTIPLKVVDGLREIKTPFGPSDIFQEYRMLDGVVTNTRLLDSDGLSHFVYRAGNSFGNKINGNDSDNIINGGGGDDTLSGLSGGDYLSGGLSNDRLLGQLGNDTLYGAEGSDVLFGGSGSDKLIGGVGSDKIYGGAGIDKLNGMVGNDTLIGGAGADLFIFSSGSNRDHINDFHINENDHLRLNKNLWSEKLDIVDVFVKYGHILNGNLILDFDHGDSIVIMGVISIKSIYSFVDVVH